MHNILIALAMYVGIDYCVHHLHIKLRDCRQVGTQLVDLIYVMMTPHLWPRGGKTTSHSTPSLATRPPSSLRPQNQTQKGPELTAPRLHHVTSTSKGAPKPRAL